MKNKKKSRKLGFGGESMKSVKTKIVAIVLGCIILASTAIGAVSIMNSRRVVLEDSTRIMNLLCENKAENINALFSRIEQSVNTLSIHSLDQLKDVNQFITDSEYVNQYSEDLKDVAVNAAGNTEGALTVYIRFNPEITEPTSGIFCGRNRSDGKFKELEPTDLSRYNEDDMLRVGWFYEAEKSKKGVWLNPYYNENIDVEMISYVVPIYKENIFIGVVGMDIEFRMLTDIVKETSVYETGYAFLTNEDAEVVCHQALSAGTDLKKYNSGEIKRMAGMLTDSEDNGNQLLEYTFQGERKNAAFRGLINGMRMVLSVPSSEINEQANKLIVQIILGVLVVIGMAVIFTIFFTRRMVKPLLELTEAAKKVAAGDLNVSVTHQSKDEVGILADSFRQTVAHLHQYIAYINELAYRDLLTGVKNKTAYLELIEQMDGLGRIKKSCYAVVVFDINDLKTINDTKGHDFGDIYIMSACKIISKTFKKSSVYRIGGDEFVVLLEGEEYSFYESLLMCFEEEIKKYNSGVGDDMKVSIARGVAIYNEETDLNFNDVFKRADNSMYRNKAEMKQRRHSLQED